MPLEIAGKLLQKLELQSGVSKTGSTWQKQEFVIETAAQYPKKICISLWGDKTDMLNSLQIGDTIIASFDVESREFNGKWYTNVQAWKVEKQGIQASSAFANADTASPANMTPSDSFYDSEMEPLPY